MICEKIKLNQKGSTDKAYATTYILDYSEEIGINKRPVIVICPGGGYAFVSDREAEMMAVSYNAMGYHAVVVRYSVAPAVYPTALLELGSVIAMLHEKAEEWRIDTDKIIITGSSAGGHLTASYGMFWNRGMIADKLGVDSSVLKPAGMILNYPVITSGEYAHRGSFENLLHGFYDEMVDEMSLENQVNEDTPKAFVWHTFEDDAVPVQNSLLLASAMKEKNIPVELHIYAKGGHGLGLANELTACPNGYGVEPICESWLSLVKTWLKENF